MSRRDSKKGRIARDKLHDKFGHTMVINLGLITFRGSHQGFPPELGSRGVR